ncbi:MAG: hypothetical protein IH912_06995 [Proteobacteria bacterium]|nr:hypothetical protein [Pseudomonadota bacterium]
MRKARHSRTMPVIHIFLSDLGTSGEPWPCRSYLRRIFTTVDSLVFVTHLAGGVIGGNGFTWVS